jgi:hypothetical protein
VKCDEERGRWEHSPPDLRLKKCAKNSGPYQSRRTGVSITEAPQIDLTRLWLPHYILPTLSAPCNVEATDLIHGLRGPVQVMVVVAAHKHCKIRCDDT